MHSTRPSPAVRVGGWVASLAGISPRAAQIQICETNIESSLAFLHSFQPPDASCKVGSGALFPLETNAVTTPEYIYVDLWGNAREDFCFASHRRFPTESLGGADLLCDS